MDIKAGVYVVITNEIGTVMESCLVLGTSPKGKTLYCTEFSNGTPPIGKEQVDVTEIKKAKMKIKHIDYSYESIEQKYNLNGNRNATVTIGNRYHFLKNKQFEHFIERYFYNGRGWEKYPPLDEPGEIIYVPRDKSMISYGYQK